MCIICLSFAENKDIADARMMINAATREPMSGIDDNHLIDLIFLLDEAEDDNISRNNP